MGRAFLNEGSIPIVIRLVRTFRANIAGLILAEPGAPDADLGKVQARNAPVELLRQRIDLLPCRLVVGEQLDLPRLLVGQRRRDHEGRMARRVAES